jgi:hypothetical protein
MIYRQPATGVISDPNYIGGRFLNDVDDPACGGPVPTAGTGSGYTPGQLGNVINLDNYWAAKLSNSSYTLYAGAYMYVKFKAASSNPNYIGAPVAWDTFGNLGHSKYVVTPDIGAGNYLNLAGISLKANTKGYYGWIFVGPGVCNARYKASPAANNIGDAVLSIASQQYFDTLAISGTLNTFALAMAYMGYAYEAAGAVAAVSIHPVFFI